MFSYSQLQEENRQWVAHNFPGRRRLEPVLGLMEEFGELDNAMDAAGEADALADVTIFAADLCNAYEIELETIVLEALSQVSARPRLLTTLGKIAHHALKDSQKIRGTHTQHVSAIRLAMIDLFVFVHVSCRQRGLVLLPLVEKTWKGIVQKRDWRPPSGQASPAP